MDTLTDLDRLSREATREELPMLLGRVVEVEARLRLRLAEVSTSTAAATPPEPIDVDAAVAIAGTSKRWLLAATKGEKFRKDHSRKVVKFDEVGLREWLLLPKKRTR